MSDVPPIGHNNPPSPLDVVALVLGLADTHAGMIVRTKELQVAMVAFFEQWEADGVNATSAPAATENFKMLRDQMDDIESKRTVDKAPYLAATRALDGWFNGEKDKLKDSIERLDKLLSDYLDTGEAVTGTYGSTAKVVEGYDVEITDPKKVPRKYCSPDMKLIRAAVKAGLRAEKGMTITPSKKTRTR